MTDTLRAVVHPEAVNQDAAAERRANHSGDPAVMAMRLWLRHAIAESARAWALAAGAYPDLYDGSWRWMPPGELNRGAIDDYS